MNKILVTSLDKRFQKFEKKIKFACQKILKILGKNNVLVEIYLINSQKMRFLNKKFRLDKTRTKTNHTRTNTDSQQKSVSSQSKSAPTVLSFEEPRNFILPASKYKKIGEIYLNLPTMTMTMTMTKNNTGHRYRHSHSYYLVHGLLHLLGYNHKKKSDRIKMEKKEKEILLTIDH